MSIIKIAYTVLCLFFLFSCSEKEPFGILLKNNSDKVVFVRIDYTYPESMPSYIESPTDFPFRTENNFFEYAEKIEPKENRFIEISESYDYQTLIIVEDLIVRRYSWDVIVKSKKYTILQFSKKEIEKRGNIVEYDGFIRAD